MTTEKERVFYQNEAVRMLLAILPHGSGINGDWDFEFKNRSRRIYMDNYYHCLDENGYYDGYCYFTAVIDWDDPDYFRLMFHGRKSQYLAEKYGLREYLTDTICECFEYAGLHDSVTDSIKAIN